MLFRFLQANPAIRLLLPLLLGILLGNSVSISVTILLGILVVLGVVMLLFFFFQKNSNSGVAVCNLLFFTFLGVFLVQKEKATYSLPQNLGTHYAKAIIRTEAEEKPNSMAVLLEVIALENEKRVQTFHFKALTYFQKDKTLESWQYGDTIIAKLRFQLLPKPTNPYAFDYGKLLHQRQIYGLARGEIAMATHLRASTFSLIRMAKSVQRYLAEILKHYLPNTKVRGFLQAMTLGDKTSLSPEIRLDFTNTGVVHILAVSGLHVGILFGLLNLLFRSFRKTLRGRIFLVALGLAVIWGFAFIAGLSVSILRAATMFSILQLSMLSLRPYQIYNSIALSAILLLIYNPFYIYEVGFQLSYGAVLGIVTFVPMWNREVVNPILDKLKTLVLVSLSAQIGIAPLIFYYFHQFPSYFLFTNIVVLLLAPFLLGGTLLLFIAATFPIFANIIAISLTFLTEICISFVNFMATLPYAILLNYQFDFVQVLLSYGFIFMVLGYVFKRNKTFFYTVLSLLFVGVSYTAWRSFEEQRQEIFVVHQIKEKSCYEFVGGKKAVLLMSDKLTEKELEYSIFPLWEAKNINEKEQFVLQNLSSFSLGNTQYKQKHCIFKNQHIIFCNSEMQFLEKPVKIAFLVLSKNSNWELALKNYEILGTIILDSSFSKQQSQKLQKALLARGYAVHNVSTDGAFLLE